MARIEFDRALSLAAVPRRDSAQSRGHPTGNDPREGLEKGQQQQQGCVDRFRRAEDNDDDGFSRGEEAEEEEEKENEQCLLEDEEDKGFLGNLAEQDSEKREDVLPVEHYELFAPLAVPWHQSTSPLRSPVSIATKRLSQKNPMYPGKSPMHPQKIPRQHTPATVQEHDAFVDNDKKEMEDVALALVEADDSFQRPLTRRRYQ